VIASVHELHPQPALGDFRPQLVAVHQLQAEAVITVEFVGWRTFRVYKHQPKVRAEFRIVDFGPDFGKGIARYWRVADLKGKARRRGQFKPGGLGSELIREFVLCAGLPQRLDRIPLRDLLGKYLRARVRRVRTNSLQRDIPRPLQYDVITELLGEAGSS